MVNIYPIANVHLEQIPAFGTILCRVRNDVAQTPQVLRLANILKSNIIKFSGIQVDVEVQERSGLKIQAQLVARRISFAQLASTESDEVIVADVPDISSTDSIYKFIALFCDFTDDPGLVSKRVIEMQEESICYSLKSSAHSEPEQECKRLFKRIKSGKSSQSSADAASFPVPMMSEGLVDFLYFDDIEDANEAVPACEVDEDTAQVEDMECARRQFVDKLSALIVSYVNKYRELPPMQQVDEIIRGKLVISDNRTCSPIVVNGDLDIVLPDYNEMIVDMRPLPKTLYLLFLKHPEGIVLKDLPDYAHELEEIYAQVMPGRDETLLKESVRALVDPADGSVQQKIAIIKRTFNAKMLDKDLAARYYVSGERGGRYRVNVPAELITLPRSIAM